MTTEKAIEQFKKDTATHIRYFQIAARALNVLLEPKGKHYPLIPNTEIENHDQSKYSADELDAYACFFYGDLTEDAAIAFNEAVKHHYAHNAHHWQHWLDKDGFPKHMPKESVAAMVADWLAAGRRHGAWDMAAYLNKTANEIALHVESRKYFEELLLLIGYRRSLGDWTLVYTAFTDLLAQIA